MEVSKFKIGSDIIDIKDAQARDDVVAAMNAAQDAQSTADQAVNGLDTKQDILIKGAYTGNIDDLRNSNDKNGIYFINTSTITGTAPATSGYYYMFVCGALQIAYQYNSASTGSAIISYRIYLNNAWSVWRSATFTV